MSFHAKTLIIFFIILLAFAFGGTLGEIGGKKAVMRDAFNNGVATKEIVGEKVVYRWIETHKIEQK